jgi:hypothetical protein
MPYVEPSLLCNQFWCPIQGPFFRVFIQGPFLGFFVGGGVGHSQLVPLLALLVPLVAQDMLPWNSKKALLYYHWAYYSWNGIFP